jgi:diaminohydroxyphosphoribosylaminopyrimidine deaminase/5-amino-6-(5-phosphoribosylamino)uracil reductase
VTLAPDANGVLDVADTLKALAARGITRLLVEGGARLSASLMQQRLVDRLEWFRAPRMIGGDGLPAVVGFGVDLLEDTADFIRVGVRRAGDDVMESYRR